MRLMFLSCALVLAACVSSSEIVPAGKDSYIVTGAANGGMESGQSMIAATKAANAYCTKLSKFMIIRRTDTGGSAGFGGEHSNLIFSCVDENDPEYQRPNLRKDPTTVVEDQRSK
jgi:hypothetical protein